MKCDNCEDDATHIYHADALCDDCWWVCDAKRSRMLSDEAHDRNCDQQRIWNKEDRGKAE